MSKWAGLLSSSSFSVGVTVGYRVNVVMTMNE